ncbi:2-succinyl-5-enolpyruvyl-6-hydroxy-3-cyclohexene-1-carboxylic-acid synthase [Kiritimatiellaeota bacterium B1221]|nr:2-succinyl-5-enolpyruvyl-6-hydroxy-3-cyclohexene-1-carboxylic-acid synthase [Kiritimatiellaeota bacterium B1221]
MILTENINLIWASLIVEECVRNGSDTFFLAPGSRCSPLTLAVARHPEAKCVQHFDERGLGFAALGFARATGRPGVVICTSGTAVSNLTPAVVEASMDAQPMLLLTADRPFELRNCGANQSIPQTQAFGAYVQWSMDLSTPDSSISPEAVLTTVDRAFQSLRKGPVHLNCPFREPLATQPDRTDSEAYLISLHEWDRDRSPYTSVYPSLAQPDEISLYGLKELLGENAKVLIIAGGGCSEAEALAIEQLGELQRWPIVSDVTSGLHFGPRRNPLVRHVDALVGGFGFPDLLRPDHILQFGCRFLSKKLQLAIEAQPPQTWIQVTGREGRFDPLHRVSHRFVTEIDRFCLFWDQERMLPTAPAWKQGWIDADGQVEELYHEQLDDAHTLTEPGVARAVTRMLPNLQGLVLGASMPVRDVNQFAARNKNQIHVACNRGASGIDGTLATAVGFARGLYQCVTVLLGDLSTLHDLNSLALVSKSKVPVIVIVINNRGGGIFHFLPVNDVSAEFENFFGTPHEWDFEHAAGQFDLPYARITDLEEFVQAYDEALSTRKSCLIEVETDRQQNLEQHAALAEMLKLPEK